MRPGTQAALLFAACACAVWFPLVAALQLGLCAAGPVLLGTNVPAAVCAPTLSSFLARLGVAASTCFICVCSACYFDAGLRSAVPAQLHARLRPATRDAAVPLHPGPALRAGFAAHFAPTAFCALGFALLLALVADVDVLAAGQRIFGRPRVLAAALRPLTPRALFVHKHGISTCFLMLVAAACGAVVAVAVACHAAVRGPQLALRRQLDWALLALSLGSTAPRAAVSAHAIVPAAARAAGGEPGTASPGPPRTCVRRRDWVLVRALAELVGGVGGQQLLDAMTQAEAVR